jgi:TRAP-type mannitol/chloroaromatic compound transport system substrate-binding protein
MERRKFLRTAGIGMAGAGAATISGSALAQAPAGGAGPAIKWRCVSGFPKSLDTIFGAAERLSKRVSQITGGKFQIQVFAAGEIVPGAGAAFDAVQAGTVELCHTCSYYSYGKEPTFAIGTALPFGMDCRQTNAWVYYGGGQKLLDEFYANYGIQSFLGGNTGVQMGGWFRKEINSAADIKGLKFRIPGLAGKVWAKLGAVPQQLAGGDIYPALEKGTIDAAEWVGPYDDEKLGFYKVAKNYYYPGWWEPGPVIHFMVAKKEWDKLPADYKAAFEAAAAEANVTMMADYDHVNPAALSKLLSSGVKLHKFNDGLMAAFKKAAFEVYAEESAKSPAFKKISDAYFKYATTQIAWSGVAEATMANFLHTAK